MSKSNSTYVFPAYNATSVNIPTLNWVPTWNKTQTIDFTQSTPYQFTSSDNATV